jgi:hypothetical protein
VGYALEVSGLDGCAEMGVVADVVHKGRCTTEGGKRQASWEAIVENGSTTQRGAVLQVKGQTR